LDELRKSAATWNSQQVEQDGIDSAAFDKKLNKLKKKYEKRIQSLKQENDDIRDEFNYQRQQLQDALTEQEKDLKLFEQICQALLPEKDLKKIIDRAKWDEDDDCWILPYVKRKALDADKNTAGSKLLPDINSGAGNKQALLGSHANELDYLEDAHSMRAPSPARGIVINGMALKGVGLSNGSKASVSRPSSSSPGLIGSGLGGNNANLIPLLMLNGSTAPALASQDGIAGQEKKKKKKKKKPKVVVDKVIFRSHLIV
jgi:hypothetical protein